MKKIIICQTNKLKKMKKRDITQTINNEENMIIKKSKYEYNKKLNEGIDVRKNLERSVKKYN
jgi:hypothetical protein